MKKSVKIALCLIFLPLTLFVLICMAIYKCVERKRIHSFLSSIDISDIDGITGVQFEEIVAYLFKFFGYKTSLTKKTGDYGVDVFATKKDVKYCIQAKLYYNHNVGASAIQQINTAKNYYMCDFAIAITNSKFTKQAIDMANNLNVILMDRYVLQDILVAYKTKNKKFLKRYMEKCLCGKNY